MTPFYSSDPDSHDGVTVSQHAQEQEPEIKAVKQNPAIIDLIIFTYMHFRLCISSWKGSLLRMDVNLWDQFNQSYSDIFIRSHCVLLYLLKGCEVPQSQKAKMKLTKLFVLSHLDHTMISCNSNMTNRIILSVLIMELQFKELSRQIHFHISQFN